MKHVFKLKRVYLLLLLPISLVLILLARQSSFFAEQIFALHLYKWLSQILSLITGLLPFSLSEVVIITFPLTLLLILIRFLRRIIIDKNNRRDILLKGLLNTLCAGSLLLFLFTMLGGINYYRYSFSHYSRLEVYESTVDELYALTKSLAAQANAVREMTSGRDDNGVFILTENHYRLAKKANEAMKALSTDYPVLDGHYGAPKPILLSKLMSYTEITGIFIPFTMEANVNVDVPDYTIPSTMLHELAHLRGFMREDEANFIAYLAGIKSECAELKYSSLMMALIMSGNALYRQSPDLYFELRDQYSEGIIKDIRDNSAYWTKFEGTVVSTVSNKINDTYLKANAQTDGVKSYGRMLDLLLAKFRQENNLVNER